MTSKLYLSEKFIKTHMKTAYNYAELSYAKRRRVGCVLVSADTLRLQSFGYNGTASGFDNACEDNCNVTLPDVIHAEMNTLDKMMGCHDTTEGSYLFSTTAPCLTCAVRIANAKISAVYYVDDYNNDDGLQHLNKRSIPTIKITL